MFSLYNKTPFIFIHTPKTGGGSLKLLLAESFKKDINKIKIYDTNLSIKANKRKYLKSLFNRNYFLDSPLRYHASWNQYSSFISKRLFSKCIKFSVIRNPFARFFSLYKWHKNLTQNITNSDISKFSNKSIAISLAGKTWGRNIDSTTFKDFVNNYKSLNNDELKNMVDYGILKCDKLIRFENFNNEARTFLSDLGIGDSIPHIHKTNFLEYKDYYDDKSRSLVSEIYKKDLLHFGYEF